MARYLNPFVDFGFKFIFAREESKPFLIDFLNQLLCDEPGFSPIVDLEYRDKEKSRIDRQVRGVIYDIHCVSSNGKQFTVEMQNQPQAYFFDRIQYYGTKGIVDQGITGKDWDFSYLPVYCVSLMNFVLPSHPDRFRIDVGLCDLKTKELFSDKQRYIFIQMPLFDKKRAEDCISDFDKWMYNIINMPTMDTMAFTQQSDLFNRLEKMASYANLSKEDRQAYDADLKAYRDMTGQLNYALTKGRAEGREEGRAEGRAEEKFQMVKNLAAKGMGLDFIMSVVDMTADKIKEILGK